jgi:hypothetical protein
MARKITYAQPMRYNERTDIREEWGPPLGKGGLKELTEILNGREEVEYTLTNPVTGWGEATHTLVLDDGRTYHVRVEEVG